MKTKTQTNTESQSHETKKEEIHLDLKPLKRVHLKGSLTPEFFCVCVGFVDHKMKLVKCDENNTAQSPWLYRRIRYFDTYISKCYKKAGRLLKDILIMREITNEKIIQLRKEIDGLNLKLPKAEPENVEEKRAAAYAMRQRKEIEQELNLEVEKLKTIKISIDDFEHTFFQLILSTAKAAECKIGAYLQGGGFIEQQERLTINEESKEMYERLAGNFQYSLDMDEAEIERGA